ncbi:lactate racemase domain-containing protein [Geomicrobium halophilum]|nr:lactate racemase domain-containing protein [Geomicrobium halophilum]
MSIINELLDPIPLPDMVQVEQSFDVPIVQDVAKEVQRVIQKRDVLQRIKHGDRIAIAVGSRGVAELPVLTRETVSAIKNAGGAPFIVPAMGSHGGATGDGQKEVLAELGVTEDSIGAPIVASMDVVKVGEIHDGMSIYTDKNAYEADHIIVINRIKPHTAFRGEVESGLTKMVTIGLGKQRGAEAAHILGFGHMAEHVPEMARIVCQNAPVLFGLGTIENAYDEVAKIVAIPAARFADEEPELLLEAKDMMPKLFIDPIDVLIVDEIGKDISGDGMDPNITGRFGTPYAEGGANAIKVAVLRLTYKTSGNANGIGLADVTTRAVFEQTKLEKGYANALTSTVCEVVKFPMFMESEALAVKAAIKTCHNPNFDQARVVRIKNTLDIKEIQVSKSLIPEVEKHSQLRVLSNPEPIALQV